MEGIGTSITAHRTAVSTNDVWPMTESALGTPVDCTDYQRLRVYCTVGGTNNPSWTVRACFWNSTASAWAEDSDETNTGVTNNETYMVNTYHHSSVFFVVDSKSGTNPTITVYVQGSND